MAKITHLDDHVLLTIFELCDQPEIESLLQCCKRFKHIIELFILHKQCRDLLITGIQNRGTAIHQRSFYRLSYLRRIKVSNNWQNGRYFEYVRLRHKVMYPSFLHLDRYKLYISEKGQIWCYNRHKQNLLDEQPNLVLGTISSSDVTCFTRKDGQIFGGRDNGHMFLLENEEITEERTSPDLLSSCPVVAADFSGNIFCTATKDELKLWQRSYELDRSAFDPIFTIDEEYKSVCMSGDGSQLSCGKYRDRDRSALELIDLETLTSKPLDSRTTSVYNILWRDNTTLLTANYDSTLRLFDLRTNKDALTWTDPFDSSLYTLAYDGLHGVLCGMSHHCRVNLYDLRQPRNYVQMYYPVMDERHRRGSPVYSLSCDATQLFIATDHNLRVLDFSADWARDKDYRNFFGS